MKKKVIFFSKNLKIGGMEKSLVILLNTLINDYEITLVLEEKIGILLDEIDPNINVIEYKLSANTNMLYRKVYNLVKRIFWFLKYYNKYDFSCNYATYSVIGSKLALISSKNSSLYIHSDYYNVYNSDEDKIKNFFGLVELEKFNKVIFVSNESRKNLIKVFPVLSNKGITINNFIDYKRIIKFSKEKCDIAIDKKDNNFIFIGRLDNESKNIELLLNSFLSAININKKNKLFIIGNGSYKNNIISYIQRNKLGKNIFLIDETTNPYKYLNKCDCLVMTSNYEGFPVVYFEALVLNKSIITTIKVSDESFDITNYATIVNKSEEDIVKTIINFKKSSIQNQLNYGKMNDKKLKIIKKIIEV